MNNSFGSRLKLLRKEFNYTQEELGKLINKKKTVISQYENNKTQPDFKTLTTLSKKFNCSIDFLIGLTNDRNVYNFTGEDKKILKIIDTIKVMGFSIDEIKRMFEGVNNKNITSVLRDNTDLIEISDILRVGNVRYSDAKEIADVLGYEIKWIKKDNK